MRRRPPLWLIGLLAAACAPPGNRPPQELYTTYCARCHGDRGGGVDRLRAADPKVDLTASAAIRRGDRAQVEERIANGVGTMPGFARRLSEEELARLVDFTLQLAPRRDPG